MDSDLRVKGKKSMIGEIKGLSKQKQRLENTTPR